MSEENTGVNENQAPEKEELPQWARDQITKANNQAAKYRTEKNEAVEAAKKEVEDSFASKIEELEAAGQKANEEVTASRHEVDRIKAALEAGIATDKVLSFADLLKGENPDELRSHAESLKELFGTNEAPRTSKATDPSQGQGNTHLPLNGDPLLEAVMRKIKN